MQSAMKQDMVLPVYKSAIAQMELVKCSGQRQKPATPGHTRSFHIMMPLSGCFVWQHSKAESFADTNQILLVGADREYMVAHPKGGDVSLSIQPDLAMVDELLHGTSHKGDAGLHEIAGMRPSGAALKAIGHYLGQARAASASSLETDELIVQLLSGAVDNPEAKVATGSPAVQKLVRQAKECLHEYGFEKLPLSAIAGELGVSAAHLARSFKQIEGSTLYQYHLNLRLSEALESLYKCEDVTGLAFDLGFSSHSHFTAVFRSRFGITPSQYRAEVNRLTHGKSSVAPEVVPLGAVHNDTGTYLGLARPLCAARGGDPAA
jgi:AraC family transcriptional regulator